MAPIKIKWDPEILAGGFRPSSIFDGVANNTTAPATIVGVQSAAASVNPAHRITGVLSPADNTTSGLTILVEEVARRVADLATSFSTTPTPTTVERVTMTPKVAVEHVSIKKKILTDLVRIFLM